MIVNDQQLLEFIRECPYYLTQEFIEIVEKYKGNPRDLFHRFVYLCNKISYEISYLNYSGIDMPIIVNYNPNDGIFIYYEHYLDIQENNAPYQIDIKKDGNIILISKNKILSVNYYKEPEHLIGIIKTLVATYYNFLKSKS